MRTVTVIFLAAGVCGCAGTNAKEHAVIVCTAAGYRQSDVDFAACIENNMRLARAEALHRSLERATPTQVPQKTYFEGMSYERDYHN